MDGILVVQRSAGHERPRTIDQALNRLTTAPDRFEDDSPDDVDARADREQEEMLAHLHASDKPWWRHMIRRLLTDKSS